MASNSRDLSGRIALVTGSTRGIGWASAWRLAHDGATVVINGSTSQDAVDSRVEALRGAGLDAIGIVANAANPDDIRRVYRTIFQTYKRLDILVNNAGVMIDARIGMMSDAVINDNLAINTAGAIHYLQGAAKLMQRAKAGSIINLTSIVGIQGSAGQSAYAASKAAIIGLTRSAAKELGPSGIRVNAIAPGYIQTDLVAGIDEAAIVRGIALGRPGKASDVAAVASFLASDEASYVSGQILGVDGAMTV